MRRLLPILLLLTLAMFASACSESASRSPNYSPAPESAPVNANASNSAPAAVYQDAPADRTLSSPRGSEPSRASRKPTVNTGNVGGPRKHDNENQP
jgi:PBP1b-binding outer membrane lipoprotein LpoB